MHELCRIVAGALGYTNFNAEASIVHYYHLNSTLSGHIDKSERDLTAPLLAFSLGQSGIFLIGGRTLNEKPSALWLHSGDMTVEIRTLALKYQRQSYIKEGPI